MTQLILPSEYRQPLAAADLALLDDASAAGAAAFAQTAATLDGLEQDAAARLRETLAKTLDTLQSVVSKKIEAGDLSLGFVKALDLKYRGEMTAAVREFLSQAYRAGREHGAVPDVVEHAADSDFETKHPRGPKGTPAGGKWIDKPGAGSAKKPSWMTRHGYTLSDTYPNDDGSISRLFSRPDGHEVVVNERGDDIRYKHIDPDGRETKIWTLQDLDAYLDRIHAKQHAASYARRTHRTPRGLPPEKALRFFEDKSLWITGVLKQRLLDDAKAVLYNAIKGGTAAPVVIQQLREVFDPWLGDDAAIDPAKLEQVMPYRLETILRTNATEAYNEGVKDSVQTGIESGYVIAFRSMATLDNRTTAVCEFLHEKCFRPNTDELEVFTPPRHYNCRSMLVPVTKDEGPVEFITPAEVGEGMALIQPGFGGKQRG